MTIGALKHQFRATADGDMPSVATGLLARTALALACRRMGGREPPYYLDGEQDLREQIIDEVRRRLKIKRDDQSSEAFLAIEEAIDDEIEECSGPVDYEAAYLRLEMSFPRLGRRHALSSFDLLQRELGDLIAAKTATEQALAEDETAFGPEHPDVAVDLNNLGLVLREMGALAESRASLERALAVTESAQGHEHPAVATIVTNLGALLASEGDLTGARAAFERALAIDEQIRGPAHFDVARDVHNLGLLFEAMGDLAGARAAFDRALEILDASLGPLDARTRTVKARLEGVAHELSTAARDSR